MDPSRKLADISISSARRAGDGDQAVVEDVGAPTTPLTRRPRHGQRLFGPPSDGA
jgi:hypothetical protein